MIQAWTTWGEVNVTNQSAMSFSPLSGDGFGVFFSSCPQEAAAATLCSQHADALPFSERQITFKSPVYLQKNLPPEAMERAAHESGSLWIPRANSLVSGLTKAARGPKAACSLLRMDPFASVAFDVSLSGGQTYIYIYADVKRL